MTSVDHRVQVTSAGGAGTSALLYHLHVLGLDLPQTPDWAPFKHQLEPPRPDQVPPEFRAIFLLSDPRDAVISLFRRGYQRDHQNAPADRSWWQTRRLRRLRWWILGSGDLFRMDVQLDRWLEAEVPVLFVSYEHVGSQWPILADFLGAPDLPPPRWKRRRSDWANEHPVLRAGLNRIHRPLADRIERLGPVTVNEPARGLLRTHGDDVPVVPAVQAV